MAMRSMRFIGAFTHFQRSCAQPILRTYSIVKTVMAMTSMVSKTCWLSSNSSIVSRQKVSEESRMRTRMTMEMAYASVLLSGSLSVMYILRLSTVANAAHTSSVLLSSSSLSRLLWLLYISMLLADRRMTFFSPDPSPALRFSSSPETSYLLASPRPPLCAPRRLPSPTPAPDGDVTGVITCELYTSSSVRMRSSERITSVSSILATFATIAARDFFTSCTTCTSFPT
mmetsp:Transcript_14065/g.48441  ORF Transcript_14065/g.48441 Transcript_14065/m.48441 type:complete len:228 (+) Transcript_14065:1290-1973(+)